MTDDRFGSDNSWFRQMGGGHYMTIFDQHSDQDLVYRLEVTPAGDRTAK